MGRWVAAGLGLVVVATLLSAAPAQAYVRTTTTACPGGIQFSGSSVRVVLHYGGIGGGLLEPLLAEAAMLRVHPQFNRAGGTTAEISSITTNPSALTYQTWYGDLIPTIHVGFVSSLPKGAIMSTDQGPRTNCLYNEAHIAILNNDVWSWDYATPKLDGGFYYNEDRLHGSETYFEPSYLHEVIHAFGLVHPGNAYSFLNYNRHPWTRDTTTSFDQVTPLPDDVRGLRAIYPGTSTRAEVGLFNTWFTPAPPGSPVGTPATQDRLCSPSRGNSFSASMFDTVCGTGGTNGGSTTVCANDQLRVRFTFVNYSTSDVDLTARLWLSTDDVLQTGSDVESADTYLYSGIITNANHAGQSFTVPSLSGFTSGTTIFVIMQIEGTTTTGTAVSDWRPLYGQVTVC